MLVTFLATLLVVNCVSKNPLIDASYDATDSSPSALLTHTRLMENSLADPQGKEGAGIKNFQLQKVFIATTSGLQTPHIHKKHSSSLDPDEHSRFCIFNDPTKINKAEQVEDYLATLLIKEKLSGKAMKKDFKVFYSQPKNCKSQSLSSFGLSQLINLGKYLLRSYFGKLKSLNSIPLYPGFAVTSGDESSFHSLHALLFGLLTEKQFVHTHVEKASSYFSQSKQQLNEYHDLHYFVEQAFIKENHLFKDTKAFTFGRNNLIDMIFGPDTTAKNIISHLSNMLCSKLSGSSVKTADITHEDISHIFNVSDSYNRYLTTSSTFQSYAVTRSFPLRQLVKHWFSQSFHNKQEAVFNRDLKIITFDDLFMLSFLTSLNVPVSRHIPPSSRLIFESFKPLFTVPVFHTVNPQSFQLREASNATSTPHQQHSGSNEENRPEKVVLNEALHLVTHETESTSGPMQNIDPSSLLMRSPKEFSEKRNNDLKFSTGKSPPLYIRILFNGQDVTGSVPGCESDPMIDIGLCSFGTVEVSLGITEWKQYLMRDEL